MAKLFVDCPLDYITGYLRYGHFEGEIEIPDEDMEKFKANPVEYIKENRLYFDLDLLVDDYDIRDRGSIIEVNYKELD